MLTSLPNGYIFKEREDQMNDEAISLPVMKRTKTPQWGLRYTHPTAKIRLTLGPCKDFDSVNTFLHQNHGINKLVGKFTEFHFTPAWKGRRDLEYFENEEDVRYLDLYVYKNIDAALHVSGERVQKYFVKDDDGFWVYYGDLPEVINNTMTIRLSWEAAGDGKKGPYNPREPGDEEYLRLYIDTWSEKENRWVEGNKGSYRTRMPVNTFCDVLVKALRIILLRSEEDILSGDHERICESFSRIESVAFLHFE